jgi:hypothetical protein
VELKAQTEDNNRRENLSRRRLGGGGRRRKRKKQDGKNLTQKAKAQRFQTKAGLTGGIKQQRSQYYASAIWLTPWLNLIVWYSPSRAMEIDGKVNARTVMLRSSFNEPLSDFGSDFFYSFFTFFAPSRGYYCLPFAPLRLCVRFLLSSCSCSW